jgi:hypothetical protein
MVAVAVEEGRQDISRHSDSRRYSLTSLGQCRQSLLRQRASVSAPPPGFQFRLLASGVMAVYGPGEKPVGPGRYPPAGDLKEFVADHW